MTLFVTEQGAKISRVSQRLRIEGPNSTLIKEIRFADLDEVVIVGRVNITTPAIHGLLKQGIPLHFISLSGSYLGKLSTAASKNISVRINQFKRYGDTDYRLKLSKAFVSGKIENQRILLSRHRDKISSPKLNRTLRTLKDASNKVRHSQSTEEILGLEGSSANAYFKCLSELFKKFGFNFPGRKKRPPTDPVNAMLSFGYSLLLARIWSFVEIAGLDPYLGFLHTTGYGKPSLVLDLMEEWRPCIVDSVVIRSITWGVVKPNDFEIGSVEGEEPQVLIKRHALKKLIKQIQDKLSEETVYNGKRVKNMYAMQQQVYLLIRNIENEEEYTPFRMSD